MRIAAMRLTFRIARGMGFKPWSQQARLLLRLILTTAQRVPNNPWIRLTKREKVLLAAEIVAESSRVRESIADALEFSSLSAWTFQRDLSECLRGSAA
jgi:hypothetical protein